MSTADAPLARLCSRQTCRRPARTTLTFVYSDSTAVIGPLSVHAEPHAYDLCVPHAQRMTPPRGWEIVRLEGIPVSQDEDAPAAQPGDLVADSAPLAPLSTLPGAAGTSSGAGAGAASRQSDGRQGGAEGAQTGADSSSEADAPGNPSGSAPRGWGRRRRSRLQAVSAAPEQPASHERGGPSEQSEPAGLAGSSESAGSAAEGPDAASGSAPQRLEHDAAPRGRESARGGRLRAVPAPDEAEPLPAGADPAHDEQGPEDDSFRGRPEGGFDSLTDEIFAGEGTEYVPARWGAGSPPPSMRRPHLRRGRR